VTGSGRGLLSAEFPKNFIGHYPLVIFPSGRGCGGSGGGAHGGWVVVWWRDWLSRQQYRTPAESRCLSALRAPATSTGAGLLSSAGLL